MKSKNEKSIFPLIKNDDITIDHPVTKSVLFKEDVKAEDNTEILNQNSINNKQNNFNSIWPAESDIRIEGAKYENNKLSVKLNNLSFETINTVSMGVKYTSSDTENINFVPTKISINPSRSIITIPCQKKPFKFVIRTDNMTGIGSSLNHMNW